MYTVAFVKWRGKGLTFKNNDKQDHPSWILHRTSTIIWGLQIFLDEWSSRTIDQKFGMATLVVIKHFFLRENDIFLAKILRFRGLAKAVFFHFFGTYFHFHIRSNRNCQYFRTKSWDSALDHCLSLWNDISWTSNWSSSRARLCQQPIDNILLYIELSPIEQKLLPGS